MNIEFHAIPEDGYEGPGRADVLLYLDLDCVGQHEAVLWHYKRGIYMNPTVTMML